MKLVILESKTCSKCRGAFPPEMFCNDKNRADGKHPWCRSCTQQGARRARARPGHKERQRSYGLLWSRKPENRAKNLAYQKTEAGKATKRRVKLKAKYGLSESQYTEMLAAQGSVCATCRLSFKSPKHTHTDHCHKSGKVRGILCNDCNRALGAVKDSVAILNSLAQYLEASQ